MLEQEGVDLTKVVIGHSGDSDNLDYLMEVADNGSYLGMDRFGLDVYLPTEQRVDTIVELVRRGYVEKITLAHDASCYIDYFDPQAKAQVQPNWNFLHIPNDVVPMLLKKGLTDEDIDTILVQNPRRSFRMSHVDVGRSSASQASRTLGFAATSQASVSSSRSSSASASSGRTRTALASNFRKCSIV